MYEIETRAVSNALNRVRKPNTFQKAMFWTILKQEIEISLRSQSRIKISLDFKFLDRSVNQSDDVTWANRIILLLAEVINFCFTTSCSDTVCRHRELKRHTSEWYEAKPVSFEPFFRSASPARDEIDNVLPHLYYSSNAAGKIVPAYFLVLKHFVC